MYALVTQPGNIYINFLFSQHDTSFRHFGIIFALIHYKVNASATQVGIQLQIITEVMCRLRIPTTLRSCCSQVDAHNHLLIDTIICKIRS